MKTRAKDREELDAGGVFGETPKTAVETTALPKAFSSFRLKFRSAAAFTLIEVMVATMIFFMSMFAILGVLSAGINAARILRTSGGPTAAMVAGYFVVSNKIEEGSLRGDFKDIAGYDGYQWISDAREITNDLYNMEFVVVDPQGHECSHLRDVKYYKPGSSGNHMGLNPPK